MKTIILYTTKYGSVAKAVQLLQNELQGEVRSINLQKEAAPALEAYDRVILGGSIYIGKTQKKLLQYTAANLSLLLQKRIGLFLCAGEKTTDPEQLFNSNFPIELNSHAVTKAIFGGEFNFSQMSFFDKIIVRAVAGQTESRSWLCRESIKTFARAMSS